MSGPHRNPDKLNTIGIVVVGICGSVLVYVTIVALQAFYQNDTSEIQTMADYGGNDTTSRSIKSTQQGAINEYGKNAGGAGAPPVSYRIPIDRAMKLVVDDAKVDPANLVPTQGRADKPSIKPIFGRPQKLDAPADAGSAAPAAGSADAGSAAGSAAPAAGSASATPTTPATGSTPDAAPMAPTGGQAQGGQTTGTPPSPDAKKGNAP